MAEPTQPSRVFVANAARLAETSGQIAEAARGARGRPWQTPPEDRWSGDHDDPAALTPAFDRATLVDSYARIAASGGTVGAAGAVVTQVGWVGACERAYRARHASPLRCMAAASSRRAGHASPRGVILGGAVGHVQNLLAAGGTDPSAI